MKILSGFISLCEIQLVCKQQTAQAIYLKATLIKDKLTFPCLQFFANYIKLNLAQGNIIPQKFLSYTNSSNPKEIIFSCFILLRILNSFFNSWHSDQCKWLSL
ncbi:hypothetical protein IMG5_014600 [Ichthyophthirius multifiliis]|uniref:Uncharacterized protein n=1 Tax=Ichthyophthirius multifiliis TaxID=5932 RepID=G0QK87_ICHMU|nr:hypothetical protein IMG5_014600 [Ichthyophthirius multifiliis]EGR34363.1 hypothetical protein IMG5_014600 [Ichthyophthirius multifiliis]|eukprot:XP_004039667.1 hypothetical protein IMG5_014600 [Ichthyophthirius multifiliis]